MKTVDIELFKRNKYNIAMVVNTFADIIDGFDLTEEDAIYFVRKVFKEDFKRFDDDEVVDEPKSNCIYCSAKTHCKNSTWNDNR